jgi:1-phosphatidylinositol phosphodiesterase
MPAAPTPSSPTRGTRRTAGGVLVAAIVAAALAATPGTALAADGSYRSLTAAADPDWMRDLPDALSLAALSVPGTHETMSVHGGSLVQTQEHHGDGGGTLAAQLAAGIRAVDVRVRVNGGNTFTIHHGAVYQKANLDDVIDTLGAFLGRNPTETVILRLKHECTGELGSCRDVAGQRGFREIFDMYRDNSPVARRVLWRPAVDGTGAAATPTLGEVRGKVVLAVLHTPHGGVVDGYGLADLGGWRDGSSTYVQDDYGVPNVRAIATKRDRVRRHLDRTSAGDPGRLYVNFTSGASLFAHPQQVAGGSGGVQGVNPFLLTYLNEGPEVHAPVRRTGIVYLDFPGGQLINRIIAVNR